MWVSATSMLSCYGLASCVLRFRRKLGSLNDDFVTSVNPRGNLQRDLHPPSPKHKDALGEHPALRDYLQCHDQRVREGTLGRRGKVVV